MTEVKGWNRQSVRSGEPIYQIGSPADALYRVVTGFVAEYPIHHLPDEVNNGYSGSIAHILHSGECFGEDMFRGVSRETKPVALGSVTVEWMRGAGVMESGRVARLFVEGTGIRNKLHGLKTLLADRSTEDATARLLTLFERHEPFGVELEGETYLPFTNQVLCHAIGSAPRTVWRCMDELEERGIARLHREEGVRVMDKDRLLPYAYINGHL